MQEHIERLKEMHKHFSSEWEMDIVAGLGYAIDHAESLLEKEKEVMLKYGNDICCPHHGDENDALYIWNQTFKTKEK